MSRRSLEALFCACALALPAVSRADAIESFVSINDGPLASALKDLERQTGVELLYDGDVIENVHSPAIAGKHSPEAALRQMLAGTDLTARRASSGAWIIERPTTAPLEQ